MRGWSDDTTRQVPSGDPGAGGAHGVVIVRMRWHEPTKAYVARRTAEGKTKREIMRCLKRYVAREVFRSIAVRDRDRLDNL